MIRGNQAIRWVRTASAGYSKGDILIMVFPKWNPKAERGMLRSDSEGSQGDDFGISSDFSILWRFMFILEYFHSETLARVPCRMLASEPWVRPSRNCCWAGRMVSSWLLQGGINCCSGRRHG